MAHYTITQEGIGQLTIDYCLSSFFSTNLTFRKIQGLRFSPEASDQETELITLFPDEYEIYFNDIPRRAPLGRPSINHDYRGIVMSIKHFEQDLLAGLTYLSHEAGHAKTYLDGRLLQSSQATPFARINEELEANKNGLGWLKAIQVPKIGLERAIHLMTIQNILPRVLQEADNPKTIDFLERMGISERDLALAYKRKCERVLTP